MKKFYHYLLSGLLLCLAVGLGAQPLSVDVTDASGAQGTQVCVDLVGRNWDDISGFSFSLIFDPTVLEYDASGTNGNVSGTNVNFNVTSSTPNAVRTVWNLFFATEGYTDVGPFTIGTVCFTVLQETETQLTIENMPVPIVFSTPNSGDVDDFTVTGGTINGSGGGATCDDGIQNGSETGTDCGGPDCPACPTCDDGVQNGSETGVDCGGPDCAPCASATCDDGIMNGQETGVDCGGPDCEPCGATGGGPNLDCGMGTDNFVLCLGEACDVAQNGLVCLDLTAGNLTDITAFQADIDFEPGQLFYQSITTSSALSNNINVTVQNAGKIRLLFFQPDQSGNTVADGTIIATLCFTNQTTAVTNLSFSEMSARDINNQAIQTEGNGGTVNDCTGTTPTCNDGVMNGQETGVDCGGPDCAPCTGGPTCDDGVQNGQETGVDCGGPDCAPCGTTGGPDLDCGQGTTDFVLCFGDACDVPVNGAACLDITVGNLTNITAFQADLITDAGQLTFLSWTDAGNLSHPVNANTATGVPRLLFFQPDQSGNTVPSGTIIGTACFTNLTAGASVASLDNLTARDNNGDAVSVSGSIGTVNDCATTEPTCDDGIMNGSETGIDCGGPDCEPCGTTGGPDLDCGQGTTDVTFCLGDACDVPVNGTACVAVTVGNFTNVTAFQADLITNAGELTFVSWTDAMALSHPINANTATGVPRLLFFQPDQSGNTVPGGTIIGTACFTNLTTEVATIDLQNITARDNNGDALPVDSGIGTVNDCAPMGPTCTDGIMNGNETGVDCGGPDCGPCPTCDDGVQNGLETGVDCGGPDCLPCETVCGENTTDVEVCIDNVCADAGSNVCVPIFFGNFTELGGFQFELNYPSGNLTFIEANAGTSLGPILQVGNPSAGRLTVTWNDVSLAGVTIPNNEAVLELCFTATNTETSPITFLDPDATLRAFDVFGASQPVSGNPGSVNPNGCSAGEPTCDDGIMNGSETGVDCGGPDCAPCATCDDGIMNGQETGVDCGGPDCAPCTTCNDGVMNGNETGVDCGGPDCEPCDTGGGPDTDCGMGTTDVTLCLGDVCSVGPNGEACVALTAGNFTNITAFQADIVFNTSQLTYVSWTHAGELSFPIIANQPGDFVRLLFFDPNQNPNTVDDGTVIGELCFTNLNGSEPSEITITNLSANDNTGASRPISGSSGFVNNCGGTGPTCDDGVMNGQETGVDCGGPDCDACPPAAVIFDVQDGSGNIGEIVCVDVTVSDFTDITELDLTLNFDASVLQLSSVTASSNLPGFGSGNFVTGNGTITVDYASGTPRSLADDEPLFTVCWQVLTGDETDVTLSGVSLTNGAGQNPAVTTDDGTINAGGISENLSFRVGSATGGVNQEVCVPVTTDNFDDIVGLQFAITYNAERLQFSSATPTNALLGFQVSNPEPGVVRALWADFGAMPNTLDDGTVLFDLCFTVLQACATDLVIEDIPGFPVRATDANNQTIAEVDAFPGVINNGVPCDVMPPDNLVLDLGTGSGGVNEEVCIDLVVDNFSSLTDLSFSVSYDPAIVTFERAQNFGLASISASNVSTPSAGVIAFDWNSAGSAGQSLPDGSVMLSLCFTVNALAPTNVNFANSPTIIAARNGNGQNVGIIPSGGRINPDVPMTDGMTLDIGEVTGQVGQTVCLPVTVFDPEPITGFQFTIVYDPAILQYVAGNNQFAFTGFLGINPNTPGILRVLWDEPTAMPVIAANGSMVFQICFEILDPDPTVINFADSPTPIEFSLGLNEVQVDLLPGQVNATAAPNIVSANVSNPSCFGEDDGSISLSVTGGSNLTYTWSPNVSSGPTATGLEAGTYSVTVTNPETGQNTSETYTLSTLPFQVNVADTDGVTCFGAADGSITIETVGGASPFLIDWSGSLQDGLLVQDELDSGSYSVTVTDNNGCSMSQTNINIGEPEELTVSGTAFDIEEDSPGGVNIVVEGGRPGYTYAWSGPNGYSSVAKDIDNAIDAGTYCVTVTDLNDCTDVQCFAVNAALGAGIVVDPGCFGEDNGSIDLTPTGGNGTYNYVWSSGGVTFATTQDVDDLAPGDYTVMVSSGTAEVSFTITLDEPEPIAPNATVTNATSGSNGTITLAPTGGNTPYTFAWDDGPTTQNRTGLTAGEYCVTIRDASDCTTEECFTVGSAAVSFQSTSTRPASCSDGSDGVIRMVINNGARPFSVRIEPLGTVVEVDTNVVEVMVPAGTYEVFVTDAQGAELSTTETVAAPPALTVTNTVTSDTEDDGCSGMISLGIGGGTEGYTVAWSSLQSGATISQLCSGAYVATVTDANGCTFVTDSIRVGRIDETLDAVTEVSCDGGTDGAIDVTISGGAEPYTFAWTEAGSTETIATTEDLSGVSNGDYTLTITDASGAMLSRNYTIGIAAGFAVSTTVTTNYNGFGVSCDDAADGTAVAIISGQGEFTFEWFQDDTTVDTDSILNDAAAGTYQLLVTSAGGCEIERTVELTAPTPLMLEAAITPISCGNTADGSITVTANGGVSPYTFEWDNGSTSGTLSGLGQGTYGITATDANGCIREESFELSAPETLTVTVEATPATDGCNGSVQVLVLGGSGTYRYFWPQLPNQGSNPVANGLCPGDYTIEVTDDNGCQTVTMMATVEDRRFPCLSTRDVITPNGDGLNEAFILFCSEDESVADNNIEIYNRWGQLVFETTDYNCSDDDGANCFRGRTNDGSQLAAGPYYYIFNYTNEFGDAQQLRGSLTIVRE